MTASPPLTAYSPNGSIIALANSNSNKSGLIRCYDSTAASLKFTLRIPKAKSDDGDGNEPPALRKLMFASDQYLCGWQCDSSVVIVWDLDRGVPSHAIDVSTSEKKKKKKKPESGEGEGTGIVCDVAACSAKLYALVYFPSHDKGKCRVMQYDLNSSEGRLEKKIKVGSVPGNGGGHGMGLAVYSTGTMALRMDNVLKIYDFNGEKLCKTDSLSRCESTEGTSVMVYSKEGSYLVLTVGKGNIMVFYIYKNEKSYKLQPMAVLKPKSDGMITSLEIFVSSETIGVLAFQTGFGGSYFVIPSSDKATSFDGMVPQLPTATIQTKVDNALIWSGFHPIRNHEMLFLFRQETTPGSGTILPMETLSYTDANGIQISGTIYLTAPSERDTTEVEGKNKKKRKAGNEVALPPGEQGMEASTTTDLTLARKKRNVTVMDENDENDVNVNAQEEDDFKLEDDEVGENGQSIAERLAMLSSAMEETDDEEEDDEDENEDLVGGKETRQQASAKSKLIVATATSESLTTLLTQALSSNDSIQLNIALQVTDRRMVENTIKALQLLDAQREDTVTEGFVPILLGHIVRRIARRHTLVTPLGVWIKAILLSTSQVSSRHLRDGNAADITDAENERLIKEGRDLASKLGPLRNFLNERVECFPQLLRLEGRLALMGQQL